MKVFRGVSGRNLGPSVVTIGNFDGVHLGHQAMLQRVKLQADSLGLPSLLVLFEPHPGHFFLKDKAPPRLMRFRDKVRFISDAGIDMMLCLYFSQELARYSPEQFIDKVLKQRLNARCLIVGEDFRFGYQRQGDTQLLQQRGKDFGFEVEVFDTYQLNDNKVSSTSVRASLANSDFTQAHALLGRDFFISGRVGHGEKRGRSIGVPTANIPLAAAYRIFSGVYRVNAKLDDGRLIPGVANLGTRPTVDGRGHVLEVHLLDFNESLYGKRMEVVFIEKLRDEKRFDSLDILVSQIKKDINVAKNRFKHND